MKKTERKTLYGIFAAIAVIGCAAMASAADDLIYKDDDGDMFRYEITSDGAKILGVTDNGDGKVLVPEKLPVPNQDAFSNVFYIASLGEGVSSLDVSQCASLTHLNCYPAKLTSLDVSNNTKLEYLYCNHKIFVCT